MAQLDAATVTHADADIDVSLEKALLDGSAHSIEIMTQTFYRDYLDHTNQERASYLHSALRGARTDANKEAALMLMDKNRQLASLKDASGMLPLHVALTGTPASTEIVCALLDKDTDTAKSMDKFGRLPLQLALEGVPACLEVVEKLLAAYPHATRREVGLTPSSNDDSDSASEESSTCPLYRGTLVLHCAVKGQCADIDVVEALLREYPAAATYESVSGMRPGMLPLHVAMEGSSASFEVVTALLSKNPEAAKTFCKSSFHHPSLEENFLQFEVGDETSLSAQKGMLPLHFAMEGTSADVRVVQALLESFPEAAKMPDHNGMLPLHHAMAGESADVEVIAALLEVHPAAAAHVDAAGMMPLHWALNDAKEVVTASKVSAILRRRQEDMVFEHHPDEEIRNTCKHNDDSESETPSVTSQSGPTEQSDPCPSYWECDLKHDPIVQRSGSLAQQLHLANLFALLPGGGRATSAAATALLQANPSAAKHADSKGMMPLHYAVEGTPASLELIQALLHLHPEAVDHVVDDADTNQWLPLHFAVAGDPASMELVQALLPRCPGCQSSSSVAQNESVKWDHCTATTDATAMSPRSGSVCRGQVDTPLHLALGRTVSPTTLDVVVALMAAYPEAVRQTNACGMLPLHCAMVGASISVEVVRTLLSAFPAAAAVPVPGHTFLQQSLSCSSPTEILYLSMMWGGALPLHLAVQGTPAGIGIVSTLLDQNPDAVNVEDGNGRLPLELALGAEPSALNGEPACLEVVKALLPGPSTAAGSKAYYRGCTQDCSDVMAMLNASPQPNALHWAVEGIPASVEVVEALLEIFPDAARQINTMGMYPLHSAVAGAPAGVDVVRALLQNFPAAAKYTCYNDMSSLMLALEKTTASVDVVEALLEAMAETTEGLGRDSTMWSRGVSALETALAADTPSLAVVQALLKAAPELADTKQISDERFEESTQCLHVALSTPGVCPEIVQAVLEACPDAAREQHDSTKQYPIVSALVRGLPPSCVLQLAKAWPEGVGLAFATTREPLLLGTKFIPALAFASVPKGQMPLIMRVFRGGHYQSSRRDEVVEALLEDVTLGGIVSDGKSFNSWTVLVANDKCVEIVEAILDDSRADVWHLARGVRDSKGRVAIDIATPSCRKAMEAKLLFCSRYRFLRTSPNYASDTCEVWFAKDSVPSKEGAREEREVCIKILRNKDEFERELAARAEHALEAKFAVAVMETESREATERFERERSKLPSASVFRDGESGGCFFVVMECGEYNFGEMLRNQKLAGDRNRVLAPLSDIAHVLQHIHDQGLVHCDVKPQNLVQVEGRIKGIDFDGSAKMDSLFGSKVSTAFLPPECIAWRAPGAAEGAWPDWMQSDDGLFVVRAPATKEVAPQCLAEPSIDIWQFGALMYHAMTGKALWPTDDRDNLAEDKDWAQLFEWSERVKQNKLRQVKDWRARDLLSKLLSKDRDERPLCMSDVLLDPFFTGAGEECCLGEVKQQLTALGATLDVINMRTKAMESDTLELKVMAGRALEQVKKSEAVLRKAVMGASETTCPTCFVVLPYRMADGAEGPIGQAREEHMRGLSELGREIGCAPLELVGELLQMGEGTLDREDSGDEHEDAVTVAGGDEEEEQASAKGAGAGAMMQCGKTPSGIKGRVDKWLNSRLYDESKTMYLYLVDECTGHPACSTGKDDGVYPIEIKMPRQELRRLLPLMYLSISAMSAANGAAGLARMFGFPCPQIPKSVKKKALRVAHDVAQDNSVQEFECLQSCVADAKEEAAGSKEKLAGAALREFQRLLQEKDPRCTFAGLQRVMAADGTVFWTSSYNAQLLEQGIFIDSTDRVGELTTEVAELGKRLEGAKALIEKMGLQHAASCSQTLEDETERERGGGKSTGEGASAGVFCVVKVGRGLSGKLKRKMVVVGWEEDAMLINQDLSGTIRKVFALTQLTRVLQQRSASAPHLCNNTASARACLRIVFAAQSRQKDYELQFESSDEASRFCKMLLKHNPCIEHVL